MACMSSKIDHLSSAFTHIAMINMVFLWVVAKVLVVSISRNINKPITAVIHGCS